MGAVGHFVDLPGRHNAEDHQNGRQYHLQKAGACHVHGDTHAAEAVDAAAKQPEHLGVGKAVAVQLPLTGNHGIYLSAEPGVGTAGGIHRPAVGKEQLVDLDFKGAALVAHIHPLVDHHPSPVPLDQDVAHLGPVEDHHGQIASRQGQLAAQFPGGDALRGSYAAAAHQRQGPQEQQPVQKTQSAADGHGNHLRVAFPEVDFHTGKLGPGNAHGHGDGLVVIQGGGALTGEHGLVDLIFQRGFNARLLIDTGEHRTIDNVLRHGDYEFQLLHRHGEAIQQRKIQLHQLLVGPGLVLGAGLDKVGADSLGDIVVQGEGDIACHGQAADIHLNGIS